MFRPKLLDCWRGYDRATFLADLGAGVTVGVVALPLAIGFAIASGVTPDRGLWTAIVAGFLISALGGSLVQVGGPTGAFVPILSAIVLQHGYAGLALATLMAGVLLVGMGALKLGNLIKFIPYPVTAGFTSGIAVIIFVGQLKEFLGLNVKLPGHTPPQVATLVAHLPEVNPAAMALDDAVERERHDFGIGVFKHDETGFGAADFRDRCAHRSRQSCAPGDRNLDRPPLGGPSGMLVWA